MQSEPQIFFPTLSSQMMVLSQSQKKTGRWFSNEDKWESLWLRGNKAYTFDIKSIIPKRETIRKECWVSLDIFSPAWLPECRQPSIYAPSKSSVFLGNLINFRANLKDTNKIVSQGNSPAKQSTVKISNPTRYMGFLAFCDSLLHMMSRDNSWRRKLKNISIISIREEEIISIYERRTQC